MAARSETCDALSLFAACAALDAPAAPDCDAERRIAGGLNAAISGSARRNCCSRRAARSVWLRKSARSSAGVSASGLGFFTSVVMCDLSKT